jgi:hypothetical protein
MSEYVWQHDLKGEGERLRLMSDLLDPSSEFHLTRMGVTTGWRVGSPAAIWKSVNSTSSMTSHPGRLTIWSPSARSSTIFPKGARS